MGMIGGSVVRQKKAGGERPPTAQNLRKKRLRITEWDGSASYTFWINPENYRERSDALATVKHTAAGLIVDHWGADAPRISISGTTGLGYLTEYLKLRAKVLSNFHSPQNLKPPWMRLYNFINGTADYIVIRSFELKQSAEKPTLYAYSLDAIVVGDVAKGDLQDLPPVVLTGTNDVESALDQISTALAA